MEMKEVLIKSGMSDGEAKVYLALLELGPSLAGRISRKTGTHRRNVYDITERLIKKGLVGYIIQNNRRLFEAVSPEKVLYSIKEKEKDFVEALPNLKLIYERAKEKHETNFYKGTEGLKSIFRDQLDDNKQKEILILGASKSAFDVLPFYFKWYDKDRAKKKIKVKIIASEEFEKKIPLSEIRYLPEKYANPLAINIYKDKVALILWRKNPFAILIKEEEIANSYRQYFELMWRIARAK